MPELMIQVENLTKVYGATRAVDDVTFNVRKGEVLGFLGPNGAGKSTTMKVLTCYLAPTAGRAKVAGFDVFDNSLEVRKHLGYLPEDTPLYKDMTVLEYLQFAAAMRGMASDRSEKRIKEIGGRCGLHEVAGKLVGELSRGYRQRVGLAQAMLDDPDLLILDEPTSGLDPNQIVEIRTLIKELGRAKTVVLSTHILSEVQATCDRVLIINDGIIVANGTPEQLQRTFQGAEEIGLELKTSSIRPIEEIIPKLKLVAYVNDVALLSHTGDVSKFEIHAEKGNDVRESLFRMAVSEGWIILEMQRRITSLEEVFHTLTTT